ncbi:MAG: glycosyltransferase family 2 protein [Anaeromyxobacter sp.]|nr:glycosyltransferase family 2 protein [Anaeromyxobacter sp.]
MTAAAPLSVCLTTYRRAGVVGRTIRSILGQDFGDFELIISDNASPDGTEEICREFARQDPRVRYFRNPTNIGMPGNLNAAIQRASAPLVANLHDGDEFSPSLLRRWKEALGAHPDAAFTFCQMDRLDEAGQVMGRLAPDFPERLEPRELVERMLSPLHCLSSPVWGTVMARREAYLRNGLFDPRHSFFADVAMWMRLNMTAPVVYVREPLIKLFHGERDLPYSYVNWHLARVTTSIYEEASDALHAPDAVAMARGRAMIRRLRDRRWAHALGSCFRRGRLELLDEGLQVCRLDDSALLKLLGYGGVPLLAVRRRFPGLQRLVEWADGRARGGAR